MTEQIPFDNQATDNFLEKADSLGLDNARLVEMLKTMLRIRLFEEKANELYALGKVHGTMHLSAGQEATAVGTGFAVRKGDYLINHHRGHGHFIASGADLEKMMAEFLGKDTGYCRGRGGSMHIADVTSNNLGANGIVGGSLQLAVGVGLAAKMRKEDRIVLTLFGDGASNEGIFHESLNMAKIYDLPILYICENNQYGMSASVNRVSARTPFKYRAEAYNIPGYYVDGNDVLAVYEFAKKGAEHARGGQGPFFIEFATYRYFGHSKSDRNLYRSKEEIDSWRTHRDPIIRFEGSLKDAGVIAGEEAKVMEQEVVKEIDAAVKFAEESPEPDVATLEDFVYA